MREITSHHDGHGLNESIKIEADEPGAGGASHEYKFAIDMGGGYMRSLAYIQFQHGPRNVEGSTPGVTTAAIIAALIDHLEGFQSGDLKDRDTAIAITDLENALLRIKKRADDRARRGVLGTYAK